jgi:chromosome segregation ATPase
MARQTNYAEKISAIEAKIAKKQSEIKTLKAQLSSLKNKKAADDYKALTEYMTANDLSASDVLEFIKA